MRRLVFRSLSPNNQQSGGERAALQTLREVQ